MKNEELLTRAVKEVAPRRLAEEKLESKKQLRVYFGIDPTGSRLHLGHTVPLRKLQAFAVAGHHAILLIGSYTALIGDPSGRDEMRPVLTREQVEDNLKTYKGQASKVLDFSKVEMRYNHEWLEKLNLAEIMDLARHFTVQQMLHRDMFQKRMTYRTECPSCKFQIPLFRSFDVGPEQLYGDRWPWDVTCENCGHTFRPGKKNIIEEEPISPSEFLYPLMQAYDSVVLDVDCEIGGSDQLFNMLCGRKLQKAFGKREKFVLTTPLIEGTDGRKMSKTYNNCVYLEDEPGGTQGMYGKIMSLRDELMETYFECCTDVPMEEVREILKENPRDAKARLAREIVTLYHGAHAASKAENEFETVFREKGTPADIPEVNVKKGTLLVDVLVKEKLVPSKSEFRRLVVQKGISMNDKTVTSAETEASTGVVKVGKRKFLKINLT